jgi:hypothetical protein
MHTPLIHALHAHAPPTPAHSTSAPSPGLPLTPQGFAANSGSDTRFAIELPLSDTSAAATISLVAATLSAVPAAAARGATIVYADAAAAAAARASGQARAWELQEACRQEQLSGLLLLVAPGPQDVSRGLGGVTLSCWLQGMYVLVAGGSRGVTVNITE